MRKQRNINIQFFITVLVGLVLLVILTWANAWFARQNPGGFNFLAPWIGTRALVTEGLNPYSDEVALRIQNMAYGRAAQPGESELRFVYPLYSVVVFLPYALVGDFNLARAVWMTVLEVGLILLTFFSVRLVRWRVGPMLLAVLLLFSMAWYHGVRALINGDVVVLVAVALVGAFLAMREGHDELAGVLFAFSTIKPQVVVLVLAFVVLWAARQRRGRVIGWLFGTLVLLSASSALLIPNWILENIRELFRFSDYNPLASPQMAFQAWWPWGQRLGWLLSALVAVVLLLEWRASRSSDFRGFLWTACLTLTLTPWTGIPNDPGNFVVLLPAIVLAFSLLDERWRLGGRLFVLFSLVALFLALWAVFINTMRVVNGLPVQSPIMFFPLPAFLLLALYWVRWWAVRPPTVWFDHVEH